MVMALRPVGGWPGQRPGPGFAWLLLVLQFFAQGVALILFCYRDDLRFDLWHPFYQACLYCLYSCSEGRGNGYHDLVVRRVSCGVLRLACWSASCAFPRLIIAVPVPFDILA